MNEWQRHLEVAGAGFFQRYRKRLLLPGVTLEIREELPDLPLLDVMVRVHAGRRIIRDGDDFRALQAIRTGAWQPADRRFGAGDLETDRRADRFSRFQVFLGSMLFAGFCLMYLLAALAGSEVAWLACSSILALTVILLGKRRLPELTMRGDSTTPCCKRDMSASL